MFQMAKLFGLEQQLCQFSVCAAGVSTMLKTHHWEENAAVMLKINCRDWRELKDSHLFPVLHKPQTNSFYAPAVYRALMLPLFPFTV